MAPHLATVLSVARTGSRAVRWLIRPAGSSAQAAPARWRPGQVWPRPAAASGLRQRASRLRRLLGLAVLALLSVLGTSVLGLSVLLLGLGVSSGSEAAGWVLGFTLLLGLLGAVWVARRAGALLQTVDDGQTLELGGSELDRDLFCALQELEALRRQERALPAPMRAVWRRTVQATHGALVACAGEAVLSRDAFDARQAAREDLPALVAALRAAPPSAQRDHGFARQLTLIGGHMESIAGRRDSGHQALGEHGRYLEDKYGGR